MVLHHILYYPLIAYSIEHFTDINERRDLEAGHELQSNYHAMWSDYNGSFESV